MLITNIEKSIRITLQLDGYDLELIEQALTEYRNTKTMYPEHQQHIDDMVVQLKEVMK